MTFMNFSIYSAFMLGMLGLIFHRTHLLAALICLEGMMLSLYTAMAMWITQFDSSSFSFAPMILLTFSACEAGTGLAILAATTRTHGSDLMQNMNMLQC
uniref:NADH-ubiquinone oxidoreductase chain 4L n=1 Tax=Boulengerula taitana TaxID=102246 RepID=C8UZR5_BOUTA|nr:NADH dehydrogenase subunit 4L [Boulengerula taitana]AAX58643.1 NADH dehydrogenase subunit 4L [Boulengerula taitana]ACS37022.1 NADH dehydrogenase subunit 4L [Boulengerula taitana]